MRRGGFIKHSFIFVLIASAAGITCSYFWGTEWINAVKTGFDIAVTFIQGVV